ncbi:terminase [Photobacterium ganghwense]|uniref:Terminase n=1 Tax=Photobacterium ganghwense TaxID=320778 RepID=A0A0J1H8E9_9GAMM|nr:phage terminase small subunit [Photobacterium ganghwense]KLV07978.1 terminase [Photobacterium ganghwense]PSU07084.1 terminase [Photobacterium ganghwense]QSV15839.1 terminase [Photobacterium ganghwense]
MVSPLKRQRDAILANQLAAAMPQAGTVNTDSLHIKLIELEEDRKRMRAQFNARADRTDHKRNVLIPKYKPLAETYLAAGEKYENPIFSTLIVWLFDIGDLSTAIDWCLKAIELELPTPEFIRRDWPTFCADSVLKWAETQAEHGHSIEPYFSQVFAKIRDDWRLHEEVNAKWYKFAGYFLLRDDEGKPRPSAIADKATLEQAKAFLQQANEYHSKIGVGTMISKIDMRLSALETGKNL